MINIRRSPLIGLILFIAVIFTFFLFTRNNLNINTGSSEEGDINHNQFFDKIVAQNIPELSPNDNTNIIVNTTESTEKVKACFVILIRNKDIDGIREPMKALELKFNRKYNYPYVFLNNDPFTEEFKEEIRAMTNAEVEFGLIPREHWSVPDDIDKGRMKQAFDKMRENKVIYGDMESYHHMCRFESGFFFRHELLQKYDYYWRVEPDVKFHCEIEFDPFLYMKENNKMYAFTISLHEYDTTIPTLWKTVKSWMKEKDIKLPSNNAMDFVSDDQGKSYNLCHFWTNFEIASFKLWRDPQYLEFFDYLDKAGGFFYERWGDAPVHSIYASLTLNKEQIHFFNEIGYFHGPFLHCPTQKKYRSLCDCNPKQNFDLENWSCTGKWLKMNNLDYSQN